MKKRESKSPLYKLDFQQVDCLNKKQSESVVFLSDIFEQKLTSFTKVIFQ